MNFVKGMIKSLVRRMGYEIHPVRRHRPNPGPDEMAVATVKETQFYTQWSAPFRLYTPWVGHPEFLEYCEGVKDHTLLLPVSCYMLACLARYAARLGGDLAECGVFRGGTALILARVAGRAGKRLHLFDSFQGLPNPDASHDNFYRKGDFAFGSVDSIRRLLGEHAGSTAIHAGWIPDTFAGLEQSQYSLAHIDVDLYRATLDCCAYFYPRLVCGGILVFDDYGYPACRGEKDAVDEFFADQPDKPFVLPSGQGIVLKA